MLFRTSPSAILAISQPAHAWLSGRILRAWAAPLSEPLLLAGEQHDIGWLDWETAPSFDALTGRPHLFRAVGASLHAPMWRLGVTRALEAWGAHVALLISRHGGLIYTRYVDRHKAAPADAAAADLYLSAQAPVEAGWAQGLGLDEDALRQETALVAFADALSLALCGDLKAPLALHAPDRSGVMTSFHLIERPGQPFEFALTPWPFKVDALDFEGEARALPAAGRFADEVEMKAWFAAPERATFRAKLVRE